MILDRCCVSIALILLCLSVAPARSEQSGAVSSDVPGSNGTAAAKKSKPLPWKFLASPMGVLDSSWTDASIKGFGNPEDWDCKKKPQDCTPLKVAALVRDTTGINLATAQPTYVALHVVDYAPSTGSGLADSWYLYHSKDSKWSFKKFTGQPCATQSCSLRVYGSPSMLFLFVQMNAKGVSLEDAKNQVRAQVLESRALTQIQKAAVTDQLIETGLKVNLLQVPQDAQLPTTDIAICDKDSGDQFQWFGNIGVPDTYANVHYDSAVVKRTPANVANLLSILKILGLVANARKACVELSTTVNATIWGAGRIDNIGLPSDVSIAGYRKGKDEALKDEDRSKVQIGAVGAFNDEQLYWWDASIGIPVHKIKDLQYSSSDNTVVASQVDKQSAYAMFNLMIRPVDLSDPKSNVWPRLLAGFPLSSSPWDKLFAGGGVGIPVKPLQNFQFFAGATFNRNKQPATLSAGSMGTNAQLQNDLRIKTTPKFTFGINVPVKSVLNKLLK